MKVLITPRGFHKVGLDSIKLMESKGLDVHYNSTGLAYSHEQFKALARDADAIIVGVDRMDKELIESCPNLKVICKFGVGTDNIDLEEADKRNIFVGRTIGSNSRSVAEHVIALMFAESKNLYKSIKEVKEGQWNKYTGYELADKTLGILGFGAIGKHVAKMAHGIGMKTQVYDLFEIDNRTLKEHMTQQADYETIISTSDYLTLHIPLTEETENLIDIKTLKKMKNNLCLINTARGGIVNEVDLHQALDQGIIRSAYFDVFSVEPPGSGDALLQNDSFALTPHTAARTEESEMRTCTMSTEIILKHLGLNV